MYHYYARIDTESGAFPETFPDYEPATLDANVRKAITHALDRHLLAEVHGSASGRLARVCSYYPEGMADKYADPDVVAEWYDPDLAKDTWRQPVTPRARDRPCTWTRRSWAVGGAPKKSLK